MYTPHLLVVISIIYIYHIHIHIYYYVILSFRLLLLLFLYSSILYSAYTIYTCTVYNTNINVNILLLLFFLLLPRVLVTCSYIIDIQILHIYFYYIHYCCCCLLGEMGSPRRQESPLPCVASLFACPHFFFLLCMCMCVYVLSQVKKKTLYNDIYIFASPPLLSPPHSPAHCSIYTCIHAYMHIDTPPHTSYTCIPCTICQCREKSEGVKECEMVHYFLNTPLVICFLSLSPSFSPSLAL